MSRKKVRMQDRRPFLLERLEDRITPDATFGWELAGGLYFRVDGDDSGNGVTLTTLASGDTQFSISYVEDGETFTTGGTVTAGDIAAMQFATGTSFAGFHVVTGTGNDTINAGALSGQKLWVEADGGNDAITGGGRQDKLDGSTGNDNITGGAGADVITAGAGDDVVDGGSGADNISGGTGNDNIAGGTGNDVITGDDGHDVLNGGAGSDNVSGGNGNDLITSDGADVVSGGTGGETTTVADNGGVGDKLTLTGAGTITNLDFEQVVGSAAGDTINSSGFNGGGAFAGKGVIVTGNAGNDILTGSAFADNIDGGADNDVVEGLAGADVLNGGAGTDTLSYFNSPAGATVDLSTNTVTNDGFGSVDTLTAGSFENLSGSNVGGDNLTGTSGVNTINGNGGDDNLVGLGGNDVINGGAGNDVMEGGSGNDVMDGGTEDDQLDGGLGNDVLTGGAGNDVMDGGIGSDTIRVNFDELNPNDAFFGGPSADTFVFFGVTFDDGNDDIPGNADDQPIEAEVLAAIQYLDDQLDAGMSDWDETLDAIDFQP